MEGTIESKISLRCLEHSRFTKFKSRRNMPRDIRSYFQSAKSSVSASPARAVKRRVILSDDEDEVPSSPLKRSKASASGRNQIISDTEDDVSQSKIVSPSDIFGKAPILREEAPKISKKLQKKETKGHDDHDFEATLCQLNTSDIEQKHIAGSKVDQIEKTENSKQKKSPNNAEDKKGGRKQDAKNEKHCNSSSNEEIDHRDSEHKKKSSKALSRISKTEIVHKEKKKAAREKAEASDVFEEHIQRKKEHVAMYQQYLQRGGARNPGSKEIPIGAEYCLAGVSFVITGVLESLEREEAEELIKKYGGRVLKSVSGKTDYVIVGVDAGPTKLAKAKSLNIKLISEDDLLLLIRDSSAGDPSFVVEPRKRSKDKSKPKSIESGELSPSPGKQGRRDVASKEAEKAIKEDSSDMVEHKGKEAAKGENNRHNTEIQDINENISVQALAEKYRPKNMKQILGQQGDKSNVRKLHAWLMNWHKNRSCEVKHTKPSPWAKNDDGAFYKAALLSGPPGIGKTTTVQVICNELGLDLVEFNASDTRNKKLLREEVSELLSNTSLKNYFSESKSKPTAKHVLLMDEVDGMAGNEDRGGLQELITLIKSTDVPIVCICNDRNHPKMRTLSNYTFDLRFPKPRLEQIRGAMRSICFKENINIATEDLDRLIESTNHDIRQVINHLALLVGQTGVQEKSEKKNVNKDLRLGPWEVVKNVFSAEEHKHMNIHDKSNLFFHDYNIAPLFVQENYLTVVPKGPKEKLLEKIADSAESIALGDLVERAIRSNNAWSLLPVQACYSSVIPGTTMAGHIGGQINFPAWLGRNSKAGKFSRLLQEITVHARLATGANKEAINLDYIKPLRNSIVRPLAVNGAENIDTAVNVMNHYHLLREDLDSLIELSLWPGDRDPMQFVDSKVKAAFTRAYNKSSAATPYAMSGTLKKKGASGTQAEDYLEEGEEEDMDSDENDDSVETDKMIKAKKPSGTKKAGPKGQTTDNAEAKGSKRGRGRGRGK